MSEREIFIAVLDLPASARKEYLDKACGTDAAVRTRVEALIRSHEAAGSFLGTPAVDGHEAGATRTHDGGAPADDEIPLGFLAPATRPDSLGRIGHYEVLQVLGQGGFGIVFRAFDDVLHRVVAVKVLSPQMAATSPARKRFVREARSSAQVRHENVVQVYEVGEHPLPFIVMEFIPGETLQQRLDRTGPVDVPDVVRIGRQIAEGLAAAHANDLIHRDIKPGNILLEGGAQRVKITDFGLARAADDASISQSGLIAGTPMYMAPEQAKGEKLDHRADLFSLGSLLYQMAAGRPPFRANGTLAVLKRVAEDTPRDIRELTPETPQWLCDIISKLHAKNPDERYQSAREVADVLADCEAQLKVNAKLKDFSRIPMGKRPAGKASGRWRWVAAVLLPVVALALAEAAGVTHLLRGSLPSRVPSAELKVQPAVAAFTDADVRRIAVLPAAEQVKEVAKELVRRNPGFDGRITPTIKNDAVTGLKFTTENVSDISPVRALTQLQVLDMWSYPKGALADLSPLRGMPLVVLKVEHTAVSDLSPLKGMKLEELGIQMTPTADLTALTGMPLKRFDLCGASQVTDLKPLQGMPLEYLNLAYIPLTDLSTVRGLTSLRQLILVNTLFSDLSQLQGLKLSALAIDGSKVSDLSPLKGMELSKLRLTPQNITQGWTTVREMKSLENIYIVDEKTWSAGEFWRRYDRGAFNGTEKFGADRTAAEYVLSVGGAVKVDGKDKEIKAVAELPGDGFRLTAALLASNQQVTDAGLAAFDDCANLTHLDLRFTTVGDAGMAHFQGCKGLLHLDVNTTGVTDAGLAHLKGFADLRILSLPHTAITDKGLAAFQNLKKLTFLDLNGCDIVTGSGLVAFKDCVGLLFLGLEDTGATDKDLAQFAACKSLSVLHLQGTRITNDGLTRFEDCKSISIISLANTSVSDAALAHLKEGKNLTKLALDDTKVTDAGLGELVGLEKLTELSLMKTQVTAKGVERLAKSLPMCKIKWDGGVIEPR